MPAPQRIVVTGGATNIGRAITERFLAAGARVVVGQPDPSIAASLVEKHGANRLAALRVDAGDPEQCRSFVAAAAAWLGGIDVLVNNAAVTGPGAARALAEIRSDYFDTLWRVNVGGVVFCAQAAAPWLARSEAGVIVNISSTNAFRPQRGALVYAATKAAVMSVTRSLARELAADRIRVVAIAPGDICTDQTAHIVPRADGLHADVIGQTPLGRGEVQDIAAAVCFVSSREAKFVTGATWVVDGGLLA